MTNDLKEIEREAKTLINQYCPWYKLQWMNKKTVLGQCFYGRQVIMLSKFHAQHNDRSITRNTILHEIAHALAGVGAGHGPKWKEICVKIGAKPKACASIERHNHKWELSCSCDTYKYYRKPAATTVKWAVCRKCRSGFKLNKVT
jgi:predicted SprT family Zn-dependent metalloprotease